MPPPSPRRSVELARHRGAAGKMIGVGMARARQEEPKHLAAVQRPVIPRQFGIVKNHCDVDSGLAGGQGVKADPWFAIDVGKPLRL